MKYVLILCACFFAPFVYAVDLPFTKDLFEGMPANQEVYRLSIVLKKEGFYGGELTEVYSSVISRSVSQFQAKQGIVPINGIVGTKTRYELNRIVLGWLGKSMKDVDTKKTTTPAKTEAKVTSPKTPSVTKTPAVKEVKKVVAPKPQACVHRGKTFRHGEKVRLYKYTVARPGGACPSMIRMCNDGQLEGDLSYRHHACTVASTSTTDISEPKTPSLKQPLLDDTKETTDTTKKTTTPTTTTTKTTPTTKTTGCKAGGVQFSVGATTQGCITPGRTEPTASQCLAAMMPIYTCQTGGTWTCTSQCQFNYY